MGQLYSSLNNLIVPLLYLPFLIWLVYEVFKSLKTKKFRENVLIALLGCVMLYIVQNPNEAAALGGILFTAVKAAASFVCGLFVKMVEGLNSATVTGFIR